jgi:hypothetical protein
MDDEAYVRELVAILSNPSPTGIDPADPYGLADDGIDRYDGFGRDVRVTSGRVVRGELGPQVEVGFVLDRPDDTVWRGLDREGTVTVPLDAEWRRLSGYDDPASYAPAVARSVERAARALTQQHRSRAKPRSATDLPDRGAQWQLLLDGLGFKQRPGAVREVGPGRIELSLDRGGDEPWVYTVLVTPEQWERVLLRHGIDLGPDDYFNELITGPPGREPFIVFWEDDLVFSAREELPPVHPPREPTPFIPGGAWFAYPPGESGRQVGDASFGPPDGR